MSKEDHYFYLECLSEMKKSRTQEDLLFGIDTGMHLVGFLNIRLTAWRGGGGGEVDVCTTARSSVQLLAAGHRLGCSLQILDGSSSLHPSHQGAAPGYPAPSKHPWRPCNALSWASCRGKLPPTSPFYNLLAQLPMLPEQVV